MNNNYLFISYTIILNLNRSFGGKIQGNRVKSRVEQSKYRAFIFVFT